MARIARLVVPHYPHHITQRGSRRLQTFFTDHDYRLYIDLLAKFKTQYNVDIWAYCLMPNHTHLIAIPHDSDGLAHCLSRTHRKYALIINRRNQWKGHLWQERFHSFVMDEDHLMAATRYIELNPVRAGICDRAEDWAWSSARSHLEGKDNQLLDVEPMLDRINDWHGYLQQEENKDLMKSIRSHSKTGRPAGNEEFLGHLENLTAKRLRKLKPGPRRQLS